MASVQELPTWATLDEAVSWLAATTGDQWGLPSILKAGVQLAVYLDATHATDEVMREVFQGRAEGLIAPVIFNGDVNRLAFDRGEVSLSMTRRPDGKVVMFTPPLIFPACEVRIEAASIKAIAAIAGTADTQVDLPAGQAPTKATDERAPEWHEKARRYAVEEKGRARKDGRTIGLRAQGMLVAARFEQEGIRGAQDQLLRAATIVREALQGHTATSPQERVSRSVRKG